MRKSNEQSIGEAINEMMDSYHLRERLNEVKVQHAWESLMGDAVARRTVSIRLKNKTLELRISSAPLKGELFYNAEMIKERLNEILKGDFIGQVKIL